MRRRRARRRPSAAGAPRRGWRTACRACDHIDLGAFTQPVDTLYHDLVAWLQALGNLSELAIYPTGVNDLKCDGLIIVQFIDKAANGALLNRRRGYGRRLHAINRYAHIHELVREQKLVLIGNLRLQSHGARSDVYLVINGHQCARCQ